MKSKFDWGARLDEIYAHYPEASEQPVIGITGNYGEGACKLGEYYYKAVMKSGATPIIIPPLADADAIVNTLEHIDGLILSGGGDFNPLFCGEDPMPGLGGINSERDLPELLITRLAYNRQIPMLGICRGIQTLAMALGGRVLQDISSVERHIKHSQDASREEATHTVSLEYNTMLRAIYDTESLAVNSFHHQAVADPGCRFRVAARSADKVIEAIESTEYKSIIGVQWHPECMESGQPLFNWLTKQASKYRRACKMHDHMLTLDSHCDTPMFFAQGIDFTTRDKRILVDLHKMTEGRQDATIMVAYQPQPKPGEKFADNVGFDVDSPFEYANLIFDKIEDIVVNNSRYVGIARTPSDLFRNKRAGKKSIMLGIENGIALDGNIDNVDHFANRGVVYITLCHNGDNDICDSARGSNTHGGVSDFGAQVIGRMNHCGIMVDMSHASEKSFYDAIDISAFPIVCSHSNCRALCDHPRNITDDQMRRLALTGGVMQVTLYHGFLSGKAEATARDVIAHIDHAVEVMGIDHVGLGTDFDGDGGVRGLANSSELINFTRMLLSRRYSTGDIQKIWGGNFIRVMNQVQNAKMV